MLDFSGRDEKAKYVYLYYANKLNAKNLICILVAEHSVTSKEEALDLSRFFGKW